MDEVAAVLLVRDEADIIEPVLTHWLTQVDFLVVADNNSVDGTRPILDRMASLGAPITVLDDPDPGHYQSKKMTALAQAAGDEGAEWVCAADADEVWYSPFGTIREVLGKVGPQWLAASAELYDHVPTGEDSSCVDPVRRIGWRRREPSVLPKVACRVRPDLVIWDGNHGAYFDGGTTTLPGQLVVRHFPYRSPEQMVRKARNGAAALAATDLPEDTGAHWRHYNALMDTYGEAALHSVFREHFYADYPRSRYDLIYDPAPI